MRKQLVLVKTVQKFYKFLLHSSQADGGWYTKRCVCLGYISNVSNDNSF